MNGAGLNFGQVVDITGTKMLKIKLFGQNKFIFVHSSDAQKINLDEIGFENLNY